MRAEVRVYESRSRGRRWWLERTLVDSFCVLGGKRLTRGRVKKIIRWHLDQRFYGFINKTPDGVYHAMFVGMRGRSPYHFDWYYVDVIPLTEGESHECGGNLQHTVDGDECFGPSVLVEQHPRDAGGAGE
jgi:hypothetical protein